MNTPNPKKAAKVFVKYYISTKAEVLELDARLTGGQDIETYISKIKNWSSETGHASPFVKIIRPLLPKVPYLLQTFKRDVTAKNRKNGELRTMQRSDRYHTLDEQNL